MKTQQQLFCEGLLIGAQSENPVKQKETISINFGKHQIEVNNNCNGFLVYRVNSGFWSSWSNNEEINKTFESLIIH